MRVKNPTLRVLTATILVIMAASPVWAARGSADFSKYMAIGDSYTAGVVNSSLVVSHQDKNYVAVLRDQTEADDFEIPWVSQPGIGPELQLISISPLVISPKAATPGGPTNIALERPYNNMGIPGARVHDLLSLTGFAPPDNTQQLFAQFILRGIGTTVQQAVAFQPTFMTVWIGGNDVLGAVLSGTPAALTPLEEFKDDYDEVIDLLTAGIPTAGMVLGSVADVSAVPFANTIPPVLIDPSTGQPLIIGGLPVYYIADLGGGQFGQLPPGSLVTLAASSFLATGYGIPAELAPALPPLPDIGKPLPDAVVLTPAELSIIGDHVREVNDFIFETGRKFDVPVVDFNSFFEDAKNGLHYGGIELDTSFLLGGIFSYDGFHPTDLGYALIANEFIRTINLHYGTEIPFTSITEYYANNNKSQGRRWNQRRDLLNNSTFEFTREAWDALLKITGAGHGMRMPDPVY